MKASPRLKKSKSVYVRDDNPNLQKVVSELRKFVKNTVPGVRETVNAWGVPTFENEDPFCFYMVGKSHVTFGFHFGTSLQDPEALLEGTGKNVRHVKLRTADDLGKPGLRGLVDSAARFEGKEPSRGTRGKPKSAAV